MSNSMGLSCCGISELSDIRYDDTPDESIMSIDVSDQGIIIFSDIDTNDEGPYHHGRALAGVVKKCRLGTLVALPVAVNPNTDNKVRAWMWRLNKRAVRRYQAKVRKANPDAYDHIDPYYNPYAYRRNY